MVRTDSVVSQADSGPIQASRGSCQIGNETLRPTEGLLNFLDQQRAISGHQLSGSFHTIRQADRPTEGLIVPTEGPLGSFESKSGRKTVLLGRHGPFQAD